MRKILLFLLRRPLTALGGLLAQAPKKETVFKSLSQLYYSIHKPVLNRLKTVEADGKNLKLIIFSDQHKGNKSFADDFKSNEKNYLTAMKYYYEQGFSLVLLGDCEELWKFSVEEIIAHNEPTLIAESAFFPDRYYRTFGNHDLLWKNPLDVALHLKKFFPEVPPVFEGLLIKLQYLSRPLTLFLTHGHQGDVMSDNNALSSWIIAHIWMPMQRYLRLNINAPSKDYTLRNRHNELMYEWCRRKKDLLLITGHTHKPVFASGRYFSTASVKIAQDQPQLKPGYFNTGCCCYADGDITGIEIENGCIRLIKWYHEEVQSERMVLEEKTLEEILKDFNS